MLVSTAEDGEGVSAGTGKPILVNTFLRTFGLIPSSSMFAKVTLSGSIFRTAISASFRRLWEFCNNASGKGW
jgi:hypothetical protein